MNINTKLLKKLKACESSINRFGITYPDGLVIPNGIKTIEFDCFDDNYFNDIKWLLNQKIISNINVVFKYKNGSWKKYEYDENGNMIKFENSNEYWKKYEYDENGNMIKYEDSNGSYEKYQILPYNFKIKMVK